MTQTDDILRMDAEGVSTAEIAARLGRSPAHVRQQRSRARRFWVELPRDLRPQLAPHAAARGVSVQTLIRELIQAVADDAMVDAILDDRTEDA